MSKDTMTTLPQQNPPTDSTSHSGVPTKPTGSMAKEAGPHITFSEQPIVTEIGKDIPLPSEVAKAGVTLNPTTIELPSVVKKMGVRAVDNAVAPIPTQKPVAPMPLSDEEIAKGLHQSISSSWRWLAEWCVRQLKEAHVFLKTMHGQIVRSQ